MGERLRNGVRALCNVGFGSVAVGDSDAVIEVGDAMQEREFTDLEDDGAEVEGVGNMLEVRQRVKLVRRAGVLK